jgi:hypothetical protein
MGHYVEGYVANRPVLSRLADFSDSGPHLILEDF